jgi:hypothetical protein
MAFTTANYKTFTDALAAAMLLALGDSGGGLGDNDVAAADDTGFRGRLGDLVGTINALEDDQFAELVVGLRADIAKSGYQSHMPKALASSFSKLTTLCDDSGIDGVGGIDTFATYYNTGDGGPWNALLSPHFRTLMYLVLGAYPSAHNVYAPTATLATRAIASSALGALTDGAAIDETKYAGAARLQAVITNLAFASGVTETGITVTGRVRKEDGTFADGRTFTGDITANATIYLTPTVTGDLMLDITDVQFDGGVTAITAQLNAAPPSGRTHPPT